jgi:hypothetical protein
MKGGVRLEEGERRKEDEERRKESTGPQKLYLRFFLITLAFFIELPLYGCPFSTYYP